jgi:hypothetical protein
MRNITQIILLSSILSVCLLGLLPTGTSAAQTPSHISAFSNTVIGKITATSTSSITISIKVNKRNKTATTTTATSTETITVDDKTKISRDTSNDDLNVLQIGDNARITLQRIGKMELLAKTIKVLQKHESTSTDSIGRLNKVFNKKK